MSFQTFQADDSSMRTILVVDDDFVTRRYLEAQLSRLGCQLVFATNGLEALEILEAKRPDLVLLDIVMPGMDGFEVCRRIKGNLETNDIPVIHLTSLVGEAKDQSFACGADDFLNKPPNFLELRSRIRSHLLIKSLQTELLRRESVRRLWRWEKSQMAQVLVVESQADQRESLISELRALGHDVWWTEGIAGCLEKLKTELPDLLILNHQLEDGNGCAFASHLRNYVRSQDLPILILCSRSALEKDISAVETGPIDYLTMPFQSAELKVRVNVLLRQGELLMAGTPRGSGMGKQLLLDPSTGAFTDAFLEAHLDLLQKSLAGSAVPLALLGAGCYSGTGDWGELKGLITKSAALLNSTLKPGEALCRVADRTFVLVLPGVDPVQLDERIRELRQVGFDGVLSGMMVPRNTPATAVLRTIAQALQKSDPSHPEP